MKPLAAVLGVVLLGLVLVISHHWRVGATVIGVAFCLAGGLRLVLSKEHLGDLAVRSRGVDAALLLVMGFSLVALANAVPPGQ